LRKGNIATFGRKIPPPCLKRGARGKKDLFIERWKKRKREKRGGSSKRGKGRKREHISRSEGERSSASMRGRSLNPFEVVKKRSAAICSCKEKG